MKFLLCSGLQLHIMMIFHFSSQHFVTVFSRHEFIYFLMQLPPHPTHTQHTHTHTQHTHTHTHPTHTHTHNFTLLSEDFYYLSKSKVFLGGMQCSYLTLVSAKPDKDQKPEYM